MLNKNLVFALIISMLTAAGMYYFSEVNVALSIGQIVTLAISMLAWLSLIHFQQHTYPSQTLLKSFLPTGKKQTDENKLTNTLNLLVSSIQSELSTQIDATEAELAQVKSLIDIAIDGLVDSFISLETSVRVEQSLVMLLTSNESATDNNELNPFKEKQLKSKQLLNDIASKLNTLIKNTNQNESASKALKKIEKEAENTVKNLELVLDKLGNTVDAIFIDELRNSARKLHSSINHAGSTADTLYADSQVYARESKDIASKINTIMDENANNVALVAEEIAATTSKIEKDVQTAVKSLQFQDMTTQLITQCSERQKLMQSIVASVSIGEDNSKVSIQDLEVKLSAAHAKLKQVSNVRMKQFNVDGGSVELF